MVYVIHTPYTFGKLTGYVVSLSQLHSAADNEVVTSWKYALSILKNRSLLYYEW